MPALARKLPPELIHRTAERESSVELCPAPRRKVLRPEHSLAARVFNAACLDSRLSNGQLARPASLDEKRIRDMRHGERSVRLDQLLVLPPAVEDAIGEFLVAHSKARAIPVCSAQLTLPGIE